MVKHGVLKGIVGRKRDEKTKQNETSGRLKEAAINLIKWFLPGRYERAVSAYEKNPTKETFRKAAVEDEYYVGEAYYDRRVTLDDVVCFEKYLKSKGIPLKPNLATAVNDEQFFYRPLRRPFRPSKPIKITHEMEEELMRYYRHEVERRLKREEAKKKIIGEVNAEDYDVDEYLVRDIKKKDFVVYKGALMLKRQEYNEVEPFITDYMPEPDDNAEYIMANAELELGETEKAVERFNRLKEKYEEKAVKGLTRAYVLDNNIEELLGVINKYQARTLNFFKEIDITKMPLNVLVLYDLLLGRYRGSKEEKLKVKAFLGRASVKEIAALDRESLQAYIRTAPEEKLDSFCNELSLDDELLRIIAGRYHSAGDSEKEAGVIERIENKTEDERIKLYDVWIKKGKLEKLLMEEELPDDIRVRAGKHAYAEEDYENAIRFFDGISEKDTNVKKMLALSYYKTNNKAGTFNILKELNLTFGDSLELRKAYLNSAFISFLNQESSSKEVRQALGLIREREISASEFYIMGRLDMYEGDIDSAIENLRKAYGKANGKLRSLSAVELAEAYVVNKMYSTALKLLRDIEGISSPRLMYLKSRVEVGINSFDINTLEERFRKIEKEDIKKGMKLVLVDAYSRVGNYEMSNTYYNELMGLQEYGIYRELLDISPQLNLGTFELEKLVDTTLKIGKQHDYDKVNEILYMKLPKVEDSLRLDFNSLDYGFVEKLSRFYNGFKDEEYRHTLLALGRNDETSEMN